MSIPANDWMTSGPLRMAPDEGLVYRRVETDGGDIEYESCGFIFDDYACPEGLDAHWEALRDIWADGIPFAEACERTAYESYYSRLSIPSMN